MHIEALPVGTRAYVASGSFARKPLRGEVRINKFTSCWPEPGLQGTVEIERLPHGVKVLGEIDQSGIRQASAGELRHKALQQVMLRP